VPTPSQLAILRRHSGLDSVAIVLRKLPRKRSFSLRVSAECSCPSDGARYLFAVHAAALVRRAVEGRCSRPQLMSARYCAFGGFLNAANASRRSSTVSGGNIRTGGDWSVPPIMLREIFCSAVRWSPTDSAHRAAYKHPASQGVGSRSFATIRQRAAKKAVSLARFSDLACFTPRPLLVGMVKADHDKRRRTQTRPPPKPMTVQPHPRVIVPKFAAVVT
jgi:hypothetical protein